MYGRHFGTPKETSIQPLNDRVLIRRLDEPERIGSIIVPDIARQRAIKGEIVAVGPGKWIPGEWWRVKVDRPMVGHPEYWDYSYEWQWIEGYREVPSVYPGQTVYFNSKWHDLAPYHEGNENPFWDDQLHMVQIADIFAVIPN